MADVAPAAAPPAKKARKTKDGAAKKTKSSRPPTMQLVLKAIEAEKDPKGTSVLAIKKHIMANHKVRSAQFLNHMLRKAFEAGLAAGKLTRPKGQAETHLLAGRYRLAAKEKKPKAVSKPKPKKVAKSPAKKAAAKPKKPKTPKKKPAAAAKKAKSPKKVKKAPKKPAAKKTAVKKTPKKTAKKA